MDWGNDYFTFSDTNIEYIWRFLQIVDERGWLYVGHRATEWCPRCGTSLSQHELTQSGVYQEQQRPVALRPLPAARPPGRVGRRLDDDAVDAARRTSPRRSTRRATTGCARTASGCSRRASPTTTSSAALPGSELVGLRYEGPFDNLAARAPAVEHRVVPWDEVSLEEGTGIVHIATGCGGEDFELGRSLGLPVLTPVDEAGHFYDDYGWLHGLSTVEAADQIVGDLAERGLPRQRRHARAQLPALLALRHAAHLPHLRRLVHRRRRRARRRCSRRTQGRVGAGVHGQAHGRLAAQHGRLEHLPPPLLRPAAAVLPLRVRAAQRDRLDARSSPSGRSRASTSWSSSAAPGSTASRSAARPAASRSSASSRSATSGSTPASSPSRRSAGRTRSGSTGGYATGASAGLSGADLPDHAYWEKWFPADWVTEMREQIRLWFYSQLFMSVVLVGRSPFRRVLGYEKMLDESGREMHGSWGNMIDAEDAFARMGADVMRWQFCAQPPDRNLLFGFGPAHEIKRKLLTFWNSASVLVDLRATSRASSRRSPTSTAGRRSSRPLDRWLVARTARARSRGDGGLRGDADRQRHPRLRGLRRRPLELVHPPLPPALLRARTARRCRTLWYALVQSLRVVAPVMPFLSDHLWRNLVPGRRGLGAPRRLARVADPDRALLAEIAEVRAVVELGRQARSSSGLKLRQPLRRLIVAGAPRRRRRTRTRSPTSCASRRSSFGEVEASELRVQAQPAAARARSSAPGSREIRAALAAGRFTELADGRFQVDGARSSSRTR